MKKPTIKELQKRVDAGARWLNKVKPGWYDNIELDNLEMKDANICICGQLFGHFMDVIIDKEDYSEREEHIEEKYMMTPNQCDARGFDKRDEDSSLVYDLLTSLWLEKIIMLRRKELK